MTYNAAQSRQFSSIRTIIVDIENDGGMVIASGIEFTALTIGKDTSAIILVIGLWLDEDDHADG